MQIGQHIDLLTLAAVILVGVIMIFFITLGLASRSNQLEKEAYPFMAGNRRINLVHLLAVGALIVALQYAQYTCNKQMKTDEEVIVISP